MVGAVVEATGVMEEEDHRVGVVHRDRVGVVAEATEVEVEAAGEEEVVATKVVDMEAVVVDGVVVTKVVDMEEVAMEEVATEEVATEEEEEDTVNGVK